jgi:hypothetical protein
MSHKKELCLNLIKGLTGIAFIVALSSCQTGNVNVSKEKRPTFDFHKYNGEPVTGILPYAASVGERHHLIDNYNNRTGLIIIQY